MQHVVPVFSDGDIDRVITLCRGLTGPHELQSPIIANGPLGLVPLEAFPFCEFDYTRTCQSIIDLVKDVPGLNVNAILDDIRNGRLVNLPAALLPREMPNYPDTKCQLLILPCANNNHHVVKHFFFQTRPVDDALRLIVGEPTRLKVATANPTLQKKCFPVVV